jgi:hypothetical protein
MAARELKIIVNQIQSRFRTDKNVVCDIKFQPTAESTHEVIAAGVVGATSEAARVEIVVEAKALGADASR